MTYGHSREQLAALARGENPDAPPPETAAQEPVSLDAVLSHVKWTLSDQSRAIVQSVLDRTQTPADTAHDVAMALAGLEYERWSAQTLKEQVTAQYAAQEAPTRATVKRLWALYDHKRKTLPMQALKDALDPPIGGGQ